MKERNSGTAILIALEIIALIVVAIFSVVSELSPKKTNGFVYVDEVKEDAIPVLPETEEVEKVSNEVVEEDETIDESEEESNAEFSERVMEKISEMTTEEKIAQLFMVSPNQLTHTNTTTAAGEITKEAINEYPVGGLFYNSGNILEKDQLETMLSNTSKYMEERIGVPALLAIEEVGGDDYSKVAIVLEMDSKTSPINLGAVGDSNQAGKVSGEIASYLESVGFNTVIGPKADLSDSDIRCYGDNPDTVASMVKEAILGYEDNGINTIASTVKSEDGEIPENYVAALSSSILMVDGSNMEETVSILRNQMGYKGVILSTSMSKSIDSVVIKALNDGADMILAPMDHVACSKSIMAALEDGTLSEETLNTAVGHILSLKLD